ncbi:glycosyltransferase [Polaribacter sp. Asnod1-A03]|uniref:glycosyltransferase n=1 Tax=Polaribacter sp. Asnod1-A03 TaxID=3160581 RepID=UPI00386CEDAE
MLHKILYIHHAGELGGAPKSLSILLSGLDNKKYKPYVFMLINGPAKDLFIKANAEVIVSKKRLFAFHGTTVSGMSFRLFVKNILYIIPNIIAAYKVIKKIKPDIVHLNTSCLFVYAFVANFFFKNIKVVSHIREPLLNNFFGKILSFYNNKYVDFFIPINDYESKPFKKERLEIIKNSIDKNVYAFNSLIREKEREVIGLNKHDFIIGFFARFNFENGIEDLLSISLKLEEVDKKIKIIIYGFEPEVLSEEIKSLAKRMPNNVIVKGMVKDVQAKMQMIDLLISPFKTPHFSRSVIEAQSMSIPVLVSDVESQNTLLINDKTGYIYKPGSVDKAIDKIITLKNNKELLTLMKNNARDFAVNNFCHINNNKKVYTIYNNLLK